ncbi:2-keto-4-pentenoate hydratase [Scopulibacillus darangshiensis]|uniref:2-keto-4-pentenoate hydratase n=1 Tax=Scopulibacillus darangshiensis TaxID=442528 RepID=A0A4R2P2Y0_9BACL|nr:2-keto-4-pentenoate hydratase [Scopulibacillus darangshiensis]TCP28992.1 2-keto-4-pentenoate hydratase [Scopulibacillus darangshiensis]
MAERVKELADFLLHAEESKKGIQPLTDQYPDLSAREAYQIQLINIQKRIDAGQRVIGKKIGLTSLPMQELLGVAEPDYGHLLHGMKVENGGVILFNDVMQPKVEGEIAFVLKEDLQGPNVTMLDVLQATDFVLPALEIVDSRVDNWKIKLPDTVADNASSSFFVLGERPVQVDQVDLAGVGMILYKNDKIMNTGTGAAALGHPASCVAWLANKMAEFDVSLRAGEVILSGALSAAVVAEPGDIFRTKIAHLGDVSVRFT